MKIMKDFWVNLSTSEMRGKTKIRSSSCVKYKYFLKKVFSFLVKTILICILVESQEGCGELDSIGMGSVRKFEGVAKYQCEEGYRIEAGNDTRFCEDGTWNGTAPVCLGL